MIGVVQLRLKNVWRRLTVTRRLLPSFFILGAQKGGTTSLFYYLGQHPEISLPKTKEIHYFSKYFNLSTNWYRSFFPFKRKAMISGESTPYYFFHPKAPIHLAQKIKNPRFVVMLRNPVDRAYSHYQMEVALGHENLPTFSEAIAAETERLKGEEDAIKAGRYNFSKSHAHYSYLSRGHYADIITQWFQHFKKDQFLFVKSEDFFAAPQQELNRVCKFLEISQFTPIDLQPQFTQNYPEMNPEFRKKLEVYFEEKNNNLTNLVGEQFIW